jgi:two-component system sensor histidine kinase/response regulator
MDKTAPSCPDISILCVEDEPMTRELLGRIISIRYPDQRIFTAENGLAGLDSFRENLSDIVLTDICMPVMDGILMAQEIRKLKSDAFIIAMTAYNESYIAGEAADLFDHLIPKPLNRIKLYETIDYCIACINPKSRDNN